MAQELSKTLSPKSEARAKQLILEYANKEHEGKMGVDIDINIPELDSDQWSSSQNSNLTDSGEIDEPYRKNNKFFEKLVKLLRKDESTPNHHTHHRDHSHSKNSSSEDILSYSSKHSMDSQRSIYRHTDVGAQKRIDSIAEIQGSLDSHESSYGQNSDLVKYAEVLKDSNLKRAIKVRRRSIKRLFFICLPSLAVYLVAQYARHEMKKMDAQLEVMKIEEAKKVKAAEKDIMKSNPQLLEVKERLDSLEKTVKEMVTESKSQRSIKVTDQQREGDKTQPARKSVVEDRSTKQTSNKQETQQADNQRAAQGGSSSDKK